MHQYYGDENVLNTLTLKTEGTKSTVGVCARGLGIPKEDGQFIADLIPFERGSNWSFKDCFEGNEEKGRAPQREFINEVAKYPRLKEILLEIEGLICGRSIHASASYIFDNGYLAQNSKMRAPNGTWITAFNMADSDYMGALKIDTLTIENLDKLHKAIDLLIEDGKIKDMGSLKANYDTYLHPDRLEYNDYRMWNALDKNEIIDAFQFDSDMGKQVIVRTQPRSMLELSTANTLMRLMTQEGCDEAPMDTYRRYKDNIELWYQEMRDNGLNDDDIHILEPHLKPLFGVADTQESIMELSMDPKISGFDVVEANHLRKAVAKKKAKMVEEVKQKFFAGGATLGASSQLLNYVWNVQIRRQLGYSFSKNHCMPYTGICIQCMNIVLKFSAIYWDCACLSVNSGGTSEEEANDNGTDYGRIAKAMGDMQKQGIKIVLPDINKAKIGFSPDSENNVIIYGLKAIQGIGDIICSNIIANRPFTSMKQFYEKMQELKAVSPENKFGDSAMIQLIKAGCFDELENKPRTEIMIDFIKSISNPIKKMQMSNLDNLNELGLLTKEQKTHEYRSYRFLKYVCSKQNLVYKAGKSDSTGFYKLDDYATRYYNSQNFESTLVEGKDYQITEQGYLVKRGSLERVVDKSMEKFKAEVLTNQDFLDKINESRYLAIWKDKNISNNISQWEMDALSYYYHEHELISVDKERYNIVDFDKLNLNPVVVMNYTYRGQEKPRFELNRICGTVIDKNKNKNTVTMLTPAGVVVVKFYKGQFSFYDREISEENDDGTKTKLEKSWFKRGTKLLITGFRRGDTFVPRVYNDSIYKHSVQLIKQLNEDGSLVLQSERAGHDEE